MKKSTIINVLSAIGLMLSSFATYAATITSAQTGAWGTAATWDLNRLPISTDSVVIAAGKSVTVAANATVRSLNVVSTGYLSINSTRTVTVSGGNVTVNGNINGAGAFTFATVNGIISGSGVIENTGAMTISQGASIAATAVLTRTGSIAVSALKTFTNNGILMVSAAITGAATTSVFVNSANAYVSVGTTIMNTGILTATAAGNTVEYISSSSQTIKATTFYNLTTSGVGTKTIPTGTIVTGDLTSTSPVTAANTSSISFAGNVSLATTFNYGTSTIILNGTANQTLTLSASQSFYNLEVNKASGTVIIGSSLVVRNGLTMTAGNIDNTGYTLTLGTATTNASTRGTFTYTAGTIIGGAFERYLHASQSLATDILFPIGTATSYRPVTVNFTSIGTAGKLAYKFSTSVPSNTGLPITNGGVTSYNNFNDGQWIATATAVSTNYNLTLNGTDFSAFAIDVNTRILKNSTGAWAANGTYSTLNGSAITNTAMTGLTGYFSFASNNNCTLPTLPTISGNALPCNSTTVTYSVPSNVGSTYTWTLPSLATGSSTSSSISAVFGATTGSGVIKVKERNACGNGPEASLTVNVGPVSPNIYGYSSVAEGDLGDIYYVDSLPGYSYTWSVTAGKGTVLSSSMNRGRALIDFTGQGSETITVAVGACGTSVGATKSVFIANTVLSANLSGNIDDPNVFGGTTISTTSNIGISNGDTVTVPSSATLTGVKNLTIADSAVFVMQKAFTISGNLQVDGIINTNGFKLTLSGADKLIKGSGSIIGGGTVSVTGNKTVVSGSDISITGDLSVDASSVTITNNGSLNVTGNLTRSASSTSRVFANGNAATTTISGNVDLNTITNGSYATFTVLGACSGAITQSANATLNLASTMTGTLTATATENTVNYTGASQAISTGTYYNLGLTGTGTPTLGGNITLKGDLNANVAFAEGTRTFTFTGSGNQELHTTTNQTFYKITVNSGLDSTVNVVLYNDILVSNVITTTLGNIDLNGNTLDLGTTGSISGEKNTSRLLGRGFILASSTALSTKNKSASFGNIGVTLSTPNITNAVYPGDVTVRRIHPSEIGTNGEVGRLFDITLADQLKNSNLNVNYTTTYLEAERGTFSIDPTNLWRSTDDGKSWSKPTDVNGNPLVVAYNAGANTVTVSNVTSFSKWIPGGVVAPSGALPVEFLKVSAVRDQNVVVLNWSTATESRNKEFIVEKSVDGNNFESIATVVGVGNSNNVSNYTYDVINAPESVVFFRLKQVDFDGNHSYSKIVTVNGLGNELESNLHEQTFTVFPNPVTSNEVFLKYENATNETVVVQIFDSSEKVHYTEEINVEGDGVTKLYLVPSQTLTPGVYFVTVKTSTKLTTLKLIVE